MDLDSLTKRILDTQTKAINRAADSVQKATQRPLGPWNDTPQQIEVCDLVISRSQDARQDLRCEKPAGHEGSCWNTNQPTCAAYSGLDPYGCELLLGHESSHYNRAVGHWDEDGADPVRKGVNFGHPEARGKPKARSSAARKVFGD